MTTLQEMLDIAFHEYLNICQDTIPVLRVPGGWIYEIDGYPVFVPEPVA